MATKLHETLVTPLPKETRNQHLMLDTQFKKYNAAIAPLSYE